MRPVVTRSNFFSLLKGLYLVSRLWFDPRLGVGSGAAAWLPASAWFGTNACGAAPFVGQASCARRGKAAVRAGHTRASVLDHSQRARPAMVRSVRRARRPFCRERPRDVAESAAARWRCFRLQSQSCRQSATQTSRRRPRDQHRVVSRQRRSRGAPVARDIPHV